MNERRVHKRYEVVENVHVYRAERIGKICNISMGGLMCNCVHHNNCTSGNFDIFCPGSCVCLADLSYTLIEAKSISVPPHFIRQCHVKFDSLSPEKIFDLQAFIDAYALETNAPSQEA